MKMLTFYPDDSLVHLRLLQRYMSAGAMSLVISRGGFVVSLVLLICGCSFVVVGRFFFWERHQLYGCRPDYTTSITSQVCPVSWRNKAGGSTDTPTLTCMASGTVALLVALVYPYALVAIKGNREETEEIRSAVHMAHSSATKSRVQSHSDGDSTSALFFNVLHLTGLDHPRRSWSYFRHPNLFKSLDRRRRLRQFAACLWTELFARVTLREYTFPVVVGVLVLASAAVAPSLMTESSALLRASCIFVSLLAYVAILVVSFAAFSIILIIDPTALTGCLVFWSVYLFIHMIAYATHIWASRTPAVLKSLPLMRRVSSPQAQEVFDQIF